MDIRWEHHLLGMWHPGVLAAIVVAALIAWPIGRGTAGLVLRVKDPWRRVVYLFIPVLCIAAFVLLLPGLIFEIGWSVTHPKWSQADLWLARYLLPIPLFIALISATKRVLVHRRTRAAEQGVV